MGKISLWITDGQFYENGVLEVLASKPFVKIVTSDVIVKKGGEITLNETYIDIETNLNIVGKNLIYRLLKPPRHGYLKFRMNNDVSRPIYIFSWGFIKKNIYTSCGVSIERSNRKDSKNIFYFGVLSTVPLGVLRPFHHLKIKF